MAGAGVAPQFARRKRLLARWRSPILAVVASSSSTAPARPVIDATALPRGLYNTELDIQLNAALAQQNWRGSRRATAHGLWRRPLLGERNSLVLYAGHGTLASGIRRPRRGANHRLPI